MEVVSRSPRQEYTPIQNPFKTGFFLAIREVGAHRSKPMSRPRTETVTVIEAAVSLTGQTECVVPKMTGAQTLIGGETSSIRQ